MKQSVSDLVYLNERACRICKLQRNKQTATEPRRAFVCEFDCSLQIRHALQYKSRVDFVATFILTADSVL